MFRAFALVSIAASVCAPALTAEAQSNADRALQSVKDLRVLRVLLPQAGKPEDEAKAAALLESARVALSESNPVRAAKLCTRVLGLDAPSVHPEAQEMMGLARERNSQRAHTRAEYERFLERYPDDERAPRVRQRLQAISTAGEPAPEKRRVAGSPFGPRFDLSGSWTASKLLGTSSSGGVPGTPSSSYEFSYYAQAAGCALLRDRGISTVGLRIFNGNRYDAYMLQLNGRCSLLAGLRYNF